MTQVYEKETWRKIPRYFGLYDASDQGRIRNRKTGKVLKSFGVARNRAYQGVHLSHPDLDKPRFEYVHRLVLESFVGPCPDGKECAHIDADPRNNALDNLAWISHKANMVLRDLDGCSVVCGGSWS